MQNLKNLVWGGKVCRKYQFLKELCDPKEIRNDCPQTGIVPGIE